ncbi:conserved hypothetical protein [Roseibium sp. TrichSKD4]|uniref:hypothetical protein n=1 Tax=Roseibium sp. TrichSKD4 TaxID=744980 RepID=UPI0001E57588|nr:hypothetical protein [Roseibium sp. TrichSKD4]EFO30878.1 conserved hypothetical protein [Roseibium sp. TrichSKD4]
MGLFKRANKSSEDSGAAPKGDPTLSRDASGRLKPKAGAQQSAAHKAGSDGPASAKTPQTQPVKPAPDTSALNPKIVQSVQMSNTETASYNQELATSPPEMMVGQVTALAVQDAQNYMNAIMQIAVAAQAVAIKKAAEGPIQEAEQIPFLSQIQGIVDHAVKVYGSVSETAGTSSKTIFSDLKS